MLSTTILVLALCGQAPRNEIADMVTAGSARTTQADRIRARKAALARQNRLRERDQALQERAAMIEQQRQYEKMLPYMLENQRQMLNRQSDIERNRILDRALNGGGTLYIPSTPVYPQPVDNGNRMPLP